MIRAGVSRCSSAATPAGMSSVGGSSRIGAPRRAASGPPASASGKFAPLATTAAGTPGWKRQAEMATAVA